MKRIKGMSRKSRLMAVLFVCLAIILCVLFLNSCKHEDSVEKTQDPIVLTPEEAVNENVLENKLDMNKSNARETASYIRDAQIGLRRPQTLYNERNEGGGSVTYTVQEKLARNDATLSKEALAKTDATIVAAQPENKDVPVGIYKINNYRNWELGVGMGIHEGKTYIPVSLQRNYSKSHSVAIELHYDLKDNKVNGGEVQWKVHF
jgi:hypothetical protein